MSEDERCAPTTVTALLFGGMLDGHQTEILLDEDGCAPLERLFVGFATCSMPYRLATVRPDGVHVYVPLYG